MNIKTFDELFAEAQARQPQRKPRSEPEHNLQVDCVQWFSLQYPSLRGRLFAVPNGGHRSKTEAARLKAEGVVAGVSDLILLNEQPSVRCASHRNEDHGKELQAERQAKGMAENHHFPWRIQVRRMPYS
jgi:hypothetical protein